jgi:ketosteroid isomerase-like protein
MATTHEDEVRAASTAWTDAICRRDVDAASLILGAEYALMATGIGEMPRAAWLATLPDYVTHAIEFFDVRIHVYGDTAVMRSRCKQSATVFGADRSGEMLVTDVWVKRDGRWQVVARHTSFLAATPAST